MRLWPLLLALTVASPLLWAAAQESVRLRNGVRLRGQIVDYTDQYVVIRLSTGERRRVEREEISYLEVEYLEPYRRGLNLLRQGKPAEAVPLLDDALRHEHRLWARALALGHLMQAYVDQGHYRLALERLVRTLRDQRLPISWSHLPIWWFRDPAPQDAVELAQQWIASPQTAVAVTAASYCLASSRPGPAVQVLTADLDHTDLTRRVYARSLLALHRQYAVQPHELRNEIDRLPPSQQAGPTFALAQIFEAQGERLKAVHEYLRVAIVLYRDHRRLAAVSLYRAAGLLEQLGRSKEATRLYEELRDRYPDSPETRAAAAAGKYRKGR